MTWLKDSVPLAASNRYTTHYDLNTGVARLKINDSILNDAGVYTVVAENKAGSDRTSARLDIEKESGIDNKPIVNPSSFAYLDRPEQPAAPRQRPRDDDAEPALPARVVLPLTDTKVVEGGPCRLACKIDGYPKPSVSE